jgi:hypothetical protein
MLSQLPERRRYFAASAEWFKARARVEMTKSLYAYSTVREIERVSVPTPRVSRFEVGM